MAQSSSLCRIDIILNCAEMSDGRDDVDDLIITAKQKDGHENDDEVTAHF